MILSIIIPTKNEERNIGFCIEAVKWALNEHRIEIIVVDNHSNDRTSEIAKSNAVKVITQGPERSAQRNRGAQESEGTYLFFVDADMRVPRDTLNEVLSLIELGNAPDALYVREIIAGAGYWNSIRNFERSFYDATCIDGLRVIKRRLFAEAGGFDNEMYAAEDWDLDRRIKELSSKITITRGALIHDEGEFSLWRNLSRKRYYSGNIRYYMEKWNYDETVRRQCGLVYRFWTVFMEHGKWKRVVKRPDLMFCVWLYRILVGFIFLFARSSSAKQK